METLFINPTPGWGGPPRPPLARNCSPVKFYIESWFSFFFTFSQYVSGFICHLPKLSSSLRSAENEDFLSASQDFHYIDIAQNGKSKENATFSYGHERVFFNFWQVPKVLTSPPIHGGRWPMCWLTSIWPQRLKK